MLQGKWTGWEVHLEQELRKYALQQKPTTVNGHLSNRTADMLERGMTPEKETEMAGLVQKLNDQRSHIKFLQQEILVTCSSLSMIAVSYILCLSQKLEHERNEFS